MTVIRMWFMHQCLTKSLSTEGLYFLFWVQSEDVHASVHRARIPKRCYSHQALSITTFRLAEPRNAACLVTHSAWTEMKCDLICINDLTCTVYKRVSAECFTPLQIKSARIIMSSEWKTNRCLDIICIPTLHIIAVQWAMAAYCLSLRMESNKKQMLVMQGDISTDIQLQLHPRGEVWRHNGLSTADVAF